MSAREELHLLLDRIPESDVPTAQKFLRSLIDPVELANLTATEEGESQSEEERAAVESALADISSDIPFDNFRRIH